MVGQCNFSTPKRDVNAISLFESIENGILSSIPNFQFPISNYNMRVLILIPAYTSNYYWDQWSGRQDMILYGCQIKIPTHNYFHFIHLLKVIYIFFEPFFDKFV